MDIAKTQEIRKLLLEHFAKEEERLNFNQQQDTESQDKESHQKDSETHPQIYKELTEV